MWIFKMALFVWLMIGLLEFTIFFCLTRKGREAISSMSFGEAFLALIIQLLGGPILLVSIIVKTCKNHAK